MFEAEKRRLLKVFAGVEIQVEHVGSTSVPGLGAKPIIDILLGAEKLSVIEARIGALEACDYKYMPEHEVVLPLRRFFAKPKDRPRAFHVHAVEQGSEFWSDHLAFRDALRGDPALASRYFALKQALAKECGDDRERYTDAKGPFIQGVLRTLQVR